MNIAVVGAGIIGISSAYRIKKSYPFLNVTVIAEQFTPNNTSDGAAGILIPLDDGGTPKGTITRWFKDTKSYCQNLISANRNSADLGVIERSGYYLMKTKKDFPRWAKFMTDFMELSGDDLKQFNVPVALAFSFSTIVCEGAKYILYLTAQFIELGGTLQVMKVNNFDELSCVYNIIVNCTGLSSKWLAKDEHLYSVRGQVVRVRAPWVDKFFAYDMDIENKICIIIPNIDTCVLGVSFSKNNHNTDVLEEERKWFVSKASKILPSLKMAPLVQDWVGLRPGRLGVRLDVEDVYIRKNGGEPALLKVIHNYGHSSSGITLHWGCAGDVVLLVGKCLSDFEFL